MSCTKAATATVVHRLAERGLIDYDALVADYWPEFADGGKGEARIWHLLTHSVGLPGVEPESGVEPWDPLYPERHLPALEAMAPLRTPGASCHYHPVTYGSLLSEVVRRVTGKGVAEMLAEEIAAPLKLVAITSSPCHRSTPRRNMPLPDLERARSGGNGPGRKAPGRQIEGHMPAVIDPRRHHQPNLAGNLAPEMERLGRRVQVQASES